MIYVGKPSELLGALIESSSAPAVFLLLTTLLLSSAHVRIIY